jgi:hypothetical protein
MPDAGSGGVEVPARRVAAGYQLPERAGHCSCTLAVDDLDAILRHVETLGVDTSKRNAGEKVRTLMIADPDGNSLAFAQALDPTMAH